MEISILISIIGIISVITVAIIGAVLSYKHSSALQISRLKEEHYISYIEALHNLAANNKNYEAARRYTFCRDKLLIIGSESVVKSILSYEEKAVGKESPLHDKYLTDIIINIRKDLRIKDKDYPDVFLKKN